MKPSQVYPREDQVAELTQGLSLPLAPLHKMHLVLIAEVLTLAWNELLVERGSTLLSGGKAEVNALMTTRLNALLEEDALWSQLVRNVTRGTETISYDGSHLEKRPDLSIHLTYRRPSFPLIVECKLIDASSKKTIKLYCAKGLARFLRGEYGWATREAFMLAFVRDGSTIWSCLEPFLAKARTLQPDMYLTEALPEPMGGSGMHLARSSHSREFCYVGPPQNLPGAIAIWHLWIAASSQ